MSPWLFYAHKNRVAREVKEVRMCGEGAELTHSARTWTVPKCLSVCGGFNVCRKGAETTQWWGNLCVCVTESPVEWWKEGER